MNEDAGITVEETPYNKPKRKRNKWGIYISILLLVVGLVWYGVNVGIIPFSIIQEQAGPIVIILLGLLILIKSL
ncbi:MAG TPA: hypothetical protein PLC38_04065 [Methanobacterium sp.]|nr:MAG: hypothetical protein FGO69_11180 [Methanobacterium sp.]HOI71443.1 hypothetical protein [Methanobacterium sp.]